MTSQPHHTIGRTVVELDTGPLADVWSVQEDVSRLLQQQVLPELERRFDRLGGSEREIRLDRVVVDVGTVDPNYLAEEWVPKLLDEIERALRDRLAGFAPAEVEGETVVRERAGSDWEVLLYLLTYGRLPWWRNAQTWEASLARWGTVPPVDSQGQADLQQLLARNSDARRRFATQLPAEVRQQVLLQIQPAWRMWPALLEEAKVLLEALHLSSQTARALERESWELLLEEIDPSVPLAPLPLARWVDRWWVRVLQAWRSVAAPPFPLPIRPDLPEGAAGTGEPSDSPMGSGAGAGASDIDGRTIPTVPTGQVELNYLRAIFCDDSADRPVVVDGGARSQFGRNGIRGRSLPQICILRPLSTGVAASLPAGSGAAAKR